jgi:hypothetical protein
VVLSTDASDQDGRMLSNHKILSIKPGFAVDNPADPRDVRLSTVNSSGVSHSAAMARVTAQLTPSTCGLEREGTWRGWTPRTIATSRSGVGASPATSPATG